MVALFVYLRDGDAQPVVIFKKEGRLIKTEIDVVSHLDMVNVLRKYHVTHSIILSANQGILDDSGSP